MKWLKGNTYYPRGCSEMTNVTQTSERTFLAQTAPYGSSWHWNGLSEYNFVIPGTCSGSVWVCACTSWPLLSLLCSYLSISPQNPFTILRVHCKLFLQSGKYEWNIIVYSDIVGNHFFLFTILQSASHKSNESKWTPCTLTFSPGGQRATKTRQINR